MKAFIFRLFVNFYCMSFDDIVVGMQVYIAFCRDKKDVEMISTIINTPQFYSVLSAFTGFATAALNV